MAVVDMVHVSLVGAARLRDTVLRRLQILGVVHIDGKTPPAPLVERIHQIISAVGPAGKGDGRGDLALVAELSTLLESRKGLLAGLEALEAERTELAAWGDLDAVAARELEQGGLYLALYRDIQPSPSLDEAAHWWAVPAGLVVASFDSDFSPIDSGGASIPIPPRPAQMVDAERDELDTELRGVQSRLEESSRGHRLDRLLSELEDESQLAGARSSLLDSGEIFGLRGFCPTDRTADVESTLADLPVAVFFTEPEDGEDVPIQLRNLPGISLFEPLLSAFALPRYGEPDPTPLFAPFMGVFAGFCLGDLGYGVVLTVLSLGGLALSPTGAMRAALKLLALLGLFATVVGALLGVAFGVRLYDVLSLSSDAWLFSLTEDPRRFFYASLIFGLAQLGFGMSVRLSRRLRARQWQEALGAAAWLGVVPTAFVWGGGYSGPAPFAAVSAVILLFSVPDPQLSRRLEGGAWALYGVSSLFGNLASYARIFGLGLASGVIAQVVNEIAWSLADGWLWIAAVAVWVGGHGFNFAMATVGAIVHPARLQFLEFFGTFFEGGGKPYRPLAVLCSVDHECRRNAVSTGIVQRTSQNVSDVARVSVSLD